MTVNTRRWIRGAFTLVTALGLAAGSARAQSQAVNGTIEGTIKDASGGLLPGVTVTVHNTDTGAERVVVTDANGLYRAPLLPLGTYQVTAELSGFKKQQQTGIPITAGPSPVPHNAIAECGMPPITSVRAHASPPPPSPNYPSAQHIPTRTPTPP